MQLSYNPLNAVLEFLNVAAEQDKRYVSNTFYFCLSQYAAPSLAGQRQAMVSCHGQVPSGSEFNEINS